MLSFKYIYGYSLMNIYIYTNLIELSDKIMMYYATSNSVQ